MQGVEREKVPVTSCKSFSKKYQVNFYNDKLRGEKCNPNYILLETLNILYYNIRTNI